MRIWVLGSGSSGNCLIVESDGERIVLDAGMGPHRAAERMRSLGGQLIAGHGAPPPLGIVVTHDHGDHAAHALPLGRALRAPVYVHERLQVSGATHLPPIRGYTPGSPLALGPFVIDAIPVPHDAPHVALRVEAGGHRFAIATDVGHVRRELRPFLAGCDLVFLEANYCPQLLELGPYPPKLKRRVGGPLGHLANEQAGELARGLEDTRVDRLVLVHLSRTNNTPERALSGVRSRVRRLEVEAIVHGEARSFELGGGRRRAEQLAFAFA